MTSPTGPQTSVCMRIHKEPTNKPRRLAAPSGVGRVEFATRSSALNPHTLAGFSRILGNMYLSPFTSPRHRPRAGVHPVLLHPVGGEGPRRGDEGATRAACLVSHPDQPPGPFALTSTLSHSHPGSASRKSFGGRGGDARRCRWVSRRSSSPTDARSVESGAPAGQAWRLPCGSPSNMDRPTPLRPQPKTPTRKGPSTGWRERGPPCPLRWTWIKRKRIVGQPGIMDRQETDPVKIGSLRANDMHPDHVLKGHSWIAQGSSAALPWVAFQCRQSALKGLA